MIPSLHNEDNKQSKSVLRTEQRIRSLSSYQVSRRVNFELMIKSKQ